jgi:hypothetical protein
MSAVTDEDADDDMDEDLDDEDISRAPWTGFIAGFTVGCAAELAA